MLGLRRAALPLRLMGLLCAVMWGGLLMLTERLAQLLVPLIYGRSFGFVILVIVVVVLIPSWAMGRLITDRLTERLGLDGLIPASLGLATLGGALLIGGCGFVLLGGTWTSITTLTTIGSGAFASFIVVRETWVNPA
jgi:hypothetical protein